jgi:predicted AlkP superfamily phosphohydrolase/phosphomutase
MKGICRRLVAVLLLGVALSGCRRQPERPIDPPPLIVIGVDGGEWKVIHHLWDAGKLPNLKRMAGRGVATALHTAYNSSPVIWTTIATGVTPEVHGITDFVVPTPHGDVPVSSAVRKVPALWNMLTRAGRRVAVLGWWASWPAEKINGVVVSDRALLNLDARVSPDSYMPRFQQDLRQEADADPGLFKNDEAQRRDRVIARSAAHLVREKYDLVLLYFRSIDIVSHNEWKYFEPAGFDPIDPRELAEHRDRVPRVYEAVDQQIGRILAAASPESNVLVLSDHGFHAAHRENVKALIDMDAVLERLGYLTRRGGRDRFRAHPHLHLRLAQLRARQDAPFRPRRPRARRAGLAGGARVSAPPSGGRPRDGDQRSRGADSLRSRSPSETRGGGRPRGDRPVPLVTPVVRVQGRPFPPALRSLGRISGTHTANTHGIFLATGPDIDPKADLADIHVRDIAPTILFALGLPVGEDFAGRARTELFSEEFRRTHPLRTIKTWGTRREVEGARTSKEDEHLLNELRSLGYIG